MRDTNAGQHISRRHSKSLRRGIIASLLSVAIGLGVYAVHSGSTDSWPEVDCTVTGSRVVRADLQDSFRFTVMYKGQYHLRYTVGGHEYYVWANSSWSDPDKQFVQSKVDSLPSHCEFGVRYNPNRPSESVVVRK